MAEMMLVETYGNGCRPRYVCVQWKRLHRSASSVLNYRFSRSQIWPFRGLSLNRTSVDCDVFQYDDDDNATNDNAPVFRAAVRTGSNPVDCDSAAAAGIAVGEKLLVFGNRERCSGRLRYVRDRDGRVQLRLAPFACPDRWRWLDFSCVEIIESAAETLIVTHVEQYSQYHCWIYRRNHSSSSSTDVYVLRIADCTESALDSIDEMTLEPVISIHEISPTTPYYDRVGTSDEMVDLDPPHDPENNSTNDDEEDFWTVDESSEEFSIVSDLTTPIGSEETEAVVGVFNGKPVNEGNASDDDNDDETTKLGFRGGDNQSYQVVDSSDSSSSSSSAANKLLEKDDKDDRKRKEAKRTIGVNKNHKRHEQDQDVKSDKSAKSVHLTTAVPTSTAPRQMSSDSTKTTNLSKDLDSFDITSDGKAGGGRDEDEEEEEEGEDGSADEHSDSPKTTSGLRHLADDIELVDDHHGNRTTVSVRRGDGFSEGAKRNDKDAPTGGASQRLFDDVIVTSDARVSLRPIGAAASSASMATPRQTFFNSSFAILSTAFFLRSFGRRRSFASASSMRP